MIILKGDALFQKYLKISMSWASCSRMSGSRWVITPLWLSGLLKPCLYSSVYSCHLFLISVLLLGPYYFSFVMPICMKCSLVISNFLKELSSLSHSIIFYSIEGEKMETVTDFIFLGSKITVDDSCRDGIKRHFLTGRKGMTNLDSVLKSRKITLLT